MVEAAGKAPTVGDWLDHWLENIAARKVRARTLESLVSEGAIETLQVFRL